MINIAEEQREIVLVKRRRKRRIIHNGNNEKITNVVQRLEVPPSFFPGSTGVDPHDFFEEFIRLSSPTQEEYDSNAENYLFDLTSLNTHGNKNDYDRYYDDMDLGIQLDERSGRGKNSKRRRLKKRKFIEKEEKSNLIKVTKIVPTFLFGRSRIGRPLITSDIFQREVVSNFVQDFRWKKRNDQHKKSPNNNNEYLDWLGFSACVSNYKDAIQNRYQTDHFNTMIVTAVGAKDKKVINLFQNEFSGWLRSIIMKDNLNNLLADELTHEMHLKIDRNIKNQLDFQFFHDECSHSSNYNSCKRYGTQQISSGLLFDIRSNSNNNGSSFSGFRNNASAVAASRNNDTLLERLGGVKTFSYGAAVIEVNGSACTSEKQFAQEMKKHINQGNDNVMKINQGNDNVIKNKNYNEKATISLKLLVSRYADLVSVDRSICKINRLVERTDHNHDADNVINEYIQTAREGQPTKNQEMILSNGDHHFKEFCKKYKQLSLVEYSQSEIISPKFALERMWEKHKKLYGTLCEDSCLCCFDVQILTENVVPEFMKTIEKKNNTFNASIVNNSNTSSNKQRRHTTQVNDLKINKSPLGFVNCFAPKFLPLLRDCYPSENPRLVLKRLENMWKIHLKYKGFGKQCRSSCPCLKGWESVFNRGNVLMKGRKRENSSINSKNRDGAEPLNKTRKLMPSIGNNFIQISDDKSFSSKRKPKTIYYTEKNQQQETDLSKAQRFLDSSITKNKKTAANNSHLSTKTDALDFKPIKRKKCTPSTASIISSLSKQLNKNSHNSLNNVPVKRDSTPSLVSTSEVPRNSGNWLSKSTMSNKAAVSSTILYPSNTSNDDLSLIEMYMKDDDTAIDSSKVSDTGQVASDLSSYKSYYVTFDPSFPLGFYCVTDKKRCTVDIVSICPVGQSRKDQRIQTGTRIQAVAGKFYSRIQNHSQLRKIYLNAKKEGEDLRLKFINSTHCIKKSNGEDWNAEGKWRGTNFGEGWAGGTANVFAAKKNFTQKGAQHLSENNDVKSELHTENVFLQENLDSSNSDERWEVVNVMRPLQHHIAKPSKSLLNFKNRSLKKKNKVKFANSFETRVYRKGSFSGEALIRASEKPDTTRTGTEAVTAISIVESKSPSGNIDASCATMQDVANAIHNGTYRDLLYLLKKGAAVEQLSSKSGFQNELSFLKHHLESIEGRLVQQDGVNEELALQHADVQFKESVMKLYANALYLIVAAKNLKKWCRYEITVHKIYNVQVTEMGYNKGVRSICGTVSAFQQKIGQLPPRAIISQVVDYLHPLTFYMHHNSSMTLERRSLTIDLLMTNSIPHSSAVSLGKVTVSMEDIESKCPRSGNVGVLEIDVTTGDLLDSARIVLHIRTVDLKPDYLKNKRKEHAKKLRETTQWIKNLNGDIQKHEMERYIYTKKISTSKQNVPQPLCQLTGHICGQGEVSLLHAAIYFEEEELVKELIQLGADAYAKSCVGTALTLAVNMADRVAEKAPALITGCSEFGNGMAFDDQNEDRQANHKKNRMCYENILKMLRHQQSDNISVHS